MLTAESVSRPARTPSTPGDWRQTAACRGLESTVFFSPDQERGQDREKREKRAQQICRNCPVLRSCRDHALSTREPYGIWGGMTENDRRRHARRIRREHCTTSNEATPPARTGARG
ncbi:WhiB family transcriptional regulator [Rhodococcus sp. T2V]|uniref:WhiB family transcriptional regulator n=1 Tax=Rhodococcus sp. T2V TaxID=3034164 RepID=UPI0023E19958|nr:WhiB family transcriptional regulator [Rhodococcus sp. T2V]MDF3306239.1 WhiB family transcriptional regulator [Rhodococcus sp. T2V]